MAARAVAVAVAVAAPSVAAAVVLAALAALVLQPTWCGVVVDKAVTVTGQPSSRISRIGNHDDREENEDDKEDTTNIFVE